MLKGRKYVSIHRKFAHTALQRKKDELIPLEAKSSSILYLKKHNNKYLAPRQRNIHNVNNKPKVVFKSCFYSGNRKDKPNMKVTFSLENKCRKTKHLNKIKFSDSTSECNMRKPQKKLCVKPERINSKLPRLHVTGDCDYSVYCNPSLKVNEKIKHVEKNELLLDSSPLARNVLDINPIEFEPNPVKLNPHSRSEERLECKCIDDLRHTSIYSMIKQYEILKQKLNRAKLRQNILQNINNMVKKPNNIKEKVSKSYIHLGENKFKKEINPRNSRKLSSIVNEDYTTLVYNNTCTADENTIWRKMKAQLDSFVTSACTSQCVNDSMTIINAITNQCGDHNNQLHKTENTQVSRKECEQTSCTNMSTNHDIKNNSNCFKLVQFRKSNLDIGNDTLNKCTQYDYNIKCTCNKKNIDRTELCECSINDHEIQMHCAESQTGKQLLNIQRIKCTLMQNGRKINIGFDQCGKPCSKISQTPNISSVNSKIRKNHNPAKNCLKLESRLRSHKYKKPCSFRNICKSTQSLSSEVVDEKCLKNSLCSKTKRDRVSCRKENRLNHSKHKGNSKVSIREKAVINTSKRLRSILMSLDKANHKIKRNVNCNTGLSSKQKSRKRNKKKCCMLKEKLKRSDYFNTGKSCATRSVLSSKYVGQSILLALLRSLTKHDLNKVQSKDMKNMKRKMRELERNLNQIKKKYNKLSPKAQRCVFARNLKIFKRSKKSRKVKSGSVTLSLIRYLHHKWLQARAKRRKQVEFNSNHTYMMTIKRKPCIEIYTLCPRFYPHCLSLIQVWKQIFEILLFFLAVIVWCPCIALLEIGRILFCTFL